MPVVISGVEPEGYNGAYTATVTGDKAFTYTLSTNPGNATKMGSALSVAAGEIQQMNTTYWAQGAAARFMCWSWANLAPQMRSRR